MCCHLTFSFIYLIGVLQQFIMLFYTRVQNSLAFAVTKFSGVSLHMDWCQRAIIVSRFFDTKNILILLTYIKHQSIKKKGKKMLRCWGFPPRNLHVVGACAITRPSSPLRHLCLVGACTITRPSSPLRRLCLKLKRVQAEAKCWSRKACTPSVYLAN